ncbi:DUF6509 family protein [Sporosarcina ureilytica]|uniref:Pullulanase n=1 Tax=Sporosarcina ureilytica TaxID=298596 RepID=A0A1D8JEX4_9BACL|nr:DUF6509 family protein [Sporosarcina ureilytica]AOV07262.1 hypothetical protein BI350_06725 [Sporosarcina ureilytica]
MEITEYIAEKIVDPTGLISGERYEFRLFVMLNEEDELYTDAGVGVRAILAVDEEQDRLVVAHFFDRATDEPFDFELEEEELSTILTFCKAHYHEAE